MPKVSVIIPAFNAMQYLPKAWESVQSQTYDNWEVIIVNDGSSDRIEEWATELDARATLISQPNQGKSSARNRGIEAAHGEYLAFLDADDFWSETKLEKQVQVLDANPEIGLVYSWLALTDGHGTPTGTIIKSNAQGNVFQDICVDNILGCGSTPLIRRECFSTAGLFLPGLPLGQDWDMWIRIAAHYPFAVVQEPLVFYRQHTRNTSKDWSLMEQCRAKILERASKLHPEEPSWSHSSVHQGRSNLYLGWLALRNHEVNQSFIFWKKACKVSPLLCLSPDYIRLIIAINIMFFLGAENYNFIVTSIRKLRH